VSAWLSVCLCVCLSVYLSVCLSVGLSVSRSVWLSVCRSVCLSSCRSVWMFIGLSVGLSGCLSVCRSVCLSVCLSVCCAFVVEHDHGLRGRSESTVWALATGTRRVQRLREGRRCMSLARSPPHHPWHLGASHGRRGSFIGKCRGGARALHCRMCIFKCHPC
jgi:hypothetical protein